MRENQHTNEDPAPFKHGCLDEQRERKVEIANENVGNDLLSLKKMGFWLSNTNKGIRI